jgi:glycosyltransferase involved in cell wall biosynthesis
MKIAMFSDAYWPRVNGVSVSIDTFAHELLKLGHEVLVVCAEYPEQQTKKISHDAEGEDEEDFRPTILQVPSVTFVFSKEDRIAHFHKVFWVAKEVGRFSPDVIHLNSEFMIAHFGIYCAWYFKLPVVYTFHTLWEEYGAQYLPSIPKPFVRALARRIIKYVMRYSDTLIAPTTQVQDVIKRYKVKKDTFLLPTGIDTRYLDFSEAQKIEFKSKIETLCPVLVNKKILLFAGRITKEKNVGFLLEILPALIEKHNDIILVIVGGGPYLDDLIEMSRTMGVSGHCLFPGYFERKDLGLMYQMSHIFIFPSLTETQGLVTIEAMHSGIPVVAIGSMGTIMVMGGDNGGFMVDNDRTEFTARVLDLLDDKELYNKKSLEAKEHSKKWRIDKIALRLLEIYEITITKHKRNILLHKNMPLHKTYKRLAKILKF